jgi:hypothetical protein
MRNTMKALLGVSKTTSETMTTKIKQKCFSLSHAHFNKYLVDVIEKSSRACYKNIGKLNL